MKCVAGPSHGNDDALPDRMLAVGARPRRRHRRPRWSSCRRCGNIRRGGSSFTPVLGLALATYGPQSRPEADEVLGHLDAAGLGRHQVAKLVKGDDEDDRRHHQHRGADTCQRADHDDHPGNDQQEAKVGTPPLVFREEPVMAAGAVPPAGRRTPGRAADRRSRCCPGPGRSRPGLQGDPPVGGARHDGHHESARLKPSGGVGVEHVGHPLVGSTTTHLVEHLGDDRRRCPPQRRPTVRGRRPRPPPRWLPLSTRRRRTSYPTRPGRPAPGSGNASRSGASNSKRPEDWPSRLRRKG